MLLHVGEGHALAVGLNKLETKQPREPELIAQRVDDGIACLTEILEKMKNYFGLGQLPSMYALRIRCLHLLEKHTDGS